ncbi:MAG: type II secretion system protein [Patescibacteria group bacterium]
MYKIKNKKINSEKGFTLLEMIISLAIFTIVALVAVGALLKIMDANRKSLALKTAINNLNFTLESMSREMRVGSNYFCDNNIHAVNSNTGAQGCIPSTGGDWMITFRTSQSSGTCVLLKGYAFTNSKLYKAESTSCNAPINSTDYKELISPDIVITGSYVEVSVVSQPWAKFSFTGYTGVKLKDRTEFSLKTMVSQRIK